MCDQVEGPEGGDGCAVCLDDGYGYGYGYGQADGLTFHDSLTLSIATVLRRSWDVVTTALLSSVVRADDRSLSGAGGSFSLRVV